MDGNDMDDILKTNAEAKAKRDAEAKAKNHQ